MSAMKFFKNHVAPTLHNAVGGLIAVGVIAVGSLIGLTKIISLPIWCAILLLLPLAAGWFFFFRTRRKLRAVEKQLAEVLKRPQQFLDDYEFQGRLGVYRHKTKAGYFCGSCTPKQVVSPLREAEYGWACQIKDCRQWHPNPDKPEPKASSIDRSW